MTYHLKTTQELKDFLTEYYEEISTDDYILIIKKALGAYTFSKPKDLQESLNQIDAWQESEDPNKTTLESYGKAFKVSDIFNSDSTFFIE